MSALDLTEHTKSPSTVGDYAQGRREKKLEGLEDFHFHMLRHTYTSNLLSNGAAPKDVQELLGHADVSTTMNIYAHATREAKRTSARLLDKVVGGSLIQKVSLVSAHKGKNKGKYIRNEHLKGRYALKTQGFRED